MERNQPRRGRKEPGDTGAGAAKTQSLTREVKVSGVRSKKERVSDRLSQEEAGRFPRAMERHGRTLSEE